MTTVARTRNLDPASTNEQWKSLSPSGFQCVDQFTGIRPGTLAISDVTYLESLLCSEWVHVWGPTSYTVPDWRIGSWLRA